MNIWILNHHALLPDMPGGTRHYDFSKELVKRGHKVSVFASSFHYSLFRDFRNYNDKNYIEENHEGVDWYWIKTPKYNSNGIKRIVNMIYYYLRVLNFAKHVLKEKPDVIIGSTVHPFAPLAGIKLKKHFNTPFIFEIRDLWPQTMIDMKLWKEKSFLSMFFNKIEKKSVKNADAIISLSPLTKKYLTYKYKYTKVKYIPNGIDLNNYMQRFSKNNDQNSHSYTIKALNALKKDGKFIVLFAGSINISNKIDIIINTAKKLNADKNDNTYFAIVGKGQELENFKNTINGIGLTNINFYEPVEKKSVPEMLNVANALFLIQGNVQWGSMNKLFDYMASGKPIISAISAMHNSPLDDLKYNFKITDFEVDQTILLINKIKQLKGFEVEDIKNNQIRFVRDKYDISILVDKLENLLFSLKKMK